MEIRKRTVKGITWTVFSQISRLIIVLLVTAVLARLLRPKDFGLIAMVTVFTTFFTMFNDMGLSSAIIQKREVTDEQLSSLFWINLMEGLFVSLVFIAISPLIANFYGKAILKPIVMVTSVSFITTSLGMVQLALFFKKMDFRTVAIVEIISSFTGGVVAVAMAATGYGVWSIVCQSLVVHLVLSGLLFFLSSWKPKLIFKWNLTKEFLKFGLPLMGFSFVNYFNRNLDNLLIGKFLGASQLGYYDVAYKTLLFPLITISGVIGRVMFPALSLLNNEKARIREAYIRATRYIAFITFPLMAAVVVLAPQIVGILLGPKWHRAIFIMQILALIGGLQSLYTTVGWIFLSQGRTGTMFIVGVLMAIVYATSFIIGLHWNVEGVAVAYAIAFLLILYPYYYFPFKFIDMKFCYYLKQFRPVAIATISMGILMIGLRYFFEKVLNLGNLPILVIVAIAGTSCYLGLLFFIDRALLTGLLEIARDVKSNAPS